MFTVTLGRDGSGKSSALTPLSSWYSVIPSTEASFRGGAAWTQAVFGDAAGAVIAEHRAELRELFTSLCEHVARDLQRHGYVGKTIGVKLRYDNFQRATRDTTIDGYTNDAALIRRTAGLCLKRAPLERRLRLLGVKVAGLVRSNSALCEPAPLQPAELSLF